MNNQKPNQELFIGYIAKKKKKKKLTELLKAIICMTLSEDSMKLHIIIANKWLPLDNPFLEYCQFKNFEDRNKRTFDDVSFYFI